MPTIRDWKRSLLTLKDEPFFDLVKNYLGKVQTPFHKPTIIDSLERFLTRPEAQTRLFQLLNDEEAALAGFVLRSEGCDLDSLYAYFREEYSPLRFRSVVENLQERLILYLDESGFYQVNPILMDQLAANAAPEPVEARTADNARWEAWLSEDLFIAFLALIKEYPSLRKQNGELKKQSRDALEERLPPAGIGDRGLLLIETATALGLAEDRGGELVLLRDSLEELMALDAAERRIALTAGVAAGAWKDLPKPEAYQSGLLTVLSLLENLDPAYSYRRDSLLLHLTEEISASKPEITPRRLDRAMELLTDAGFLRMDDGFLQHSLADPAAPESTRPMILQPTFEILLSPDALPEAKAFAAVYCRLVRFDRVAKYELEHDLFLVPLRSQGAPDSLLDTLNDACGGSLPQNIAVTLRGWMEESRQIEITTGTVVKVSAEMIPILEEHFSSLILQTLAPGVYFVRPEKVTPFLTRWRSLGYTDPGEIRNLLAGTGEAGVFEYTPTLEVPRISVSANGSSAPGTADESEPSYGMSNGAQRINDELSLCLEQQELTTEQKCELGAKIDKKLFLFPEQVNPAACRIGRIEAKGIDFHAKLRVVEDVLESKSDLLEIESPEAEDGSALVHPLGIDKEPGNPVLRALVLPEEKEHSFRIRLASRIKKRKRSLFY